MNLRSVKRVFDKVDGEVAQTATGQRSGLGRQAMAFLIQQHHLSYAVGTEIEDVAGREIGVAAAAPSHFIVSSFPLSPFNSIPGHFSIGLHYMQFILSHGKVCYSIKQ